MRTADSIILLISLLFTLLLSGCGQSYDKASLEPATHSYTENTPPTCKQDSRPGNSGIINKLISKDKLSYNLRTPTNYDSNHSHPLLVVYAPAGTSAIKSERLTGLTHDATAAGFIIAYIDKVRLTLESLELLGKIPAEIAELWCIDKQQIFYTGHSDGGTISSALTFLQSSSIPPAAIVPSAAGLTTKDLAEQNCPAPLSVMVMHNSDDSLFPGYGKQAASWWAACNQCSNETTDD